MKQVFVKYCIGNSGAQEGTLILDDQACLDRDVVVALLLKVYPDITGHQLISDQTRNSGETTTTLTDDELAKKYDLKIHEIIVNGQHRPAINI